MSPLSSQDLQASFDAVPTPLLVLSAPDLRIVEVNAAYLEATWTTRGGLLGRLVFDVFPDDPQDLDPTGVRNLRASLELVRRTGRRDVMPVQRYPIARPAALGGGFRVRWWSPINVPVTGPDGQVSLIIHRVEDVTDLMEQRATAAAAGLGATEPSLVERLRATGLEAARAQAALRASQERLAMMFSRAPVGLSEIDAQGRFVTANGELARIVGRPLATLRGMSIADVTHPEDVPPSLALAARVLAEGGTASLEKRYQQPDGRCIVALSTVTRLEPAAGDGDGAVRLLAVTVDLSVQRQAQAALSESETRFRAIVDLVPDLLWSNDPGGQTDWFNRRWEEYTGQPTHQALGQGWAARVHPEDLPHTQALWREALLRPQHLVYEHRLRRHDGQYRWHLLRVEPLRDASGGVTRWFGSATDVHEQRVARDLLEQRVLQRTGELRAVIDSAASAIVALDIEGRVTRVNPAAAALWRTSGPQLVGRPARELVSLREMRRHLDGLPADVRQVMGLSRSPRPRPRRPATAAGEWRLRRPDGGVVPALVRVSLIRDDAGRPTGLLAVVTDLTERKALEEALRERTAQAEAASRAKSAFLAHMSHEFRTPLNAVIGLSHLLGQMALPERAQTFVKHIEQSGQQLLALINDVLDLSRIEAGEMHLESLPVDLPALLDAVRAMVEPQAHVKGLTLAFEQDASALRTIQGDSLRLKQILLNLLSNAVKFTARGQVTLRAAVVEGPERPCLRFEVIDTGIGISAEQRARIFEPFMQADSSTTRRFGGSGLDLSIVRRLLEIMDGRLALESAPEQGSRFSVTIPLPSGGGHQTPPS